MKIFQAMVSGALAMLSVCVVASETPVASSNGHTPSEMWINVGGFSRHFARNKGYNESNLGLGVEYRLTPDASVMAGSYYNSNRRTTTYATVNWQPYRWGEIKAGALVGLMDGYPSVARGGVFFMAVPMLTYEGKRLGLNFGLIPSIDKVDSAVFVQFKVRAF